MRTIALVALLAASVLAGCAGKAITPPSASEPSFNDLNLAPTATTGIIRGLVVDDAIRPLSAASVALSGEAGFARNTTTTAAGTFGFDALPPGTYFMKVHKAGFLDSQQSADVIAGVADPPIAKVQLRVDAANMPYFSAYVFSGYIECMTPNFAACGFANGVADILGQANVTQDHTQVRYLVDKVPDWVQTEMVWSSTQALGGSMSMSYSYHAGCNDPTGLYCDYSADGPSPLLLAAGPDAIKQIALGTGEPELYVRTFTGSAVPGAPVNSAGLTLEQSFDYYTHVFYGYQPTEGWRFSSGEPVPMPK